MTAPGIPNQFVLSTSCFGSRLKSIEDQAFAAVAMGFRKIEIGLSESPVEMNGFEDTKRETGMSVSSVVAGCLKPNTGARMASTLLGSPDDDDREQALNAVRRHIRLAQAFESSIVVVRGSSIADEGLNREADLLAADMATLGVNDDVKQKGADFSAKLQAASQPQVEHLCRSLHQIMHEFPDTRLAIEPGSHLNDLLSFDAMGWVLSDLHRQNLGYWHDIGHIHSRSRFGLPGQGDWLDAYSSRMIGVHLQDAAEGETQMPPGSGEVDHRLLADYIPKDAEKVVEVNSRHGRAEILASVRFLVDAGF